ncbi:MAG: GNAT family N-acetyltransferase [Anaerolineales bacterium]|nr:GNAT family N-acetyltransferase [Anaerolineales bacterium]
MSVETAVFTQFPELWTPRLHLRQLEPADAPAMYRFLSDEAVTRYFGIETFTHLDEAAQRINSLNASFRRRQTVRWGITQRGDGTLIGSCGFIYWRRTYRHAALGYELARPYWRQGIMTETLQAVLEYGFTTMDLNRIEALVVPENEASRTLLERLGFQAEGVLREYGYWHSRFYDLAVFSLLQREWQDGRRE